MSSRLPGADHRALHLSSTGPEFQAHVHWPRETLHSPESVSQVQSFRWTTVIGQFRCQRGSRPEWLHHNQADVMGEGWGLQRQGSHSQKIRASADKHLLTIHFHLASWVTLRVCLTFQQFRNKFNFQRQGLTHSMCLGTSISLSYRIAFFFYY